MRRRESFEIILIIHQILMTAQATHAKTEQLTPTYWLIQTVHVL